MIKKDQNSEPVNIVQKITFFFLTAQKEAKTHRGFDSPDPKRPGLRPGPVNLKPRTQNKS